MVIHCNFKLLLFIIAVKVNFSVLSRNISSWLNSARKLFQNHDISLFIFFSDNRPASATPKATNHNKQNAPRRSLNLEDYKKRRGLI